MKERFEKLADDMMTAARLTGYKVSVSRNDADVSVIFTIFTGKEIKSELYGASVMTDTEPYRCLDVNNEYTYLKTEAEFVAALTERFRDYGVDFNEIRERTAA